MSPLRSDLLEDLPRGQGPGHIGKSPNAYFEPIANIRSTKGLRFDAVHNKATKLFLGLIDAEIVAEGRLADGRVSRYAKGGIPIGLGDDRHHLLIAGSRAGKGRSFLIPNLGLLPATTSMLVVDPKGDLARYCAAYRSSLGQRCVVLDPFDVSGSITSSFRGSFNPLVMCNPEDRKTLVPNAKLIADSLIVSGQHKDRHWDDCAKQILTGLLLHVRTFGKYAGARDLVTVWRLAAELATADPDDPRRYWLEKEMLSNDGASGMVRTAARQFYDRTGGEFSSVTSNLRKHLDFIGIECLHDCLVGDGLDPRDLKRDSVAWFTSLPAMRMADLSGWLRMIVQLTLAAHEEVQVQNGGSTVMVLDEFNVLGRLESLEVAAAQIAGLSVKLVPVIQDLNQVKNHYEKSWETFIGNSGAIQVFGLADQTTREYVSKLLGQAPVLNRSTNAPTYDQAAQQAATGESWSRSVAALMDAEEVARYFGRDDKKLRQLILRPGYRPMILQRAFYDKHELFRGRFDRDV
tara:strand:+ start:2243 stop:3796 length:1554 start_codon:yes stop_codon:yes gene_type:complete